MERRGSERAIRQLKDIPITALNIFSLHQWFNVRAHEHVKIVWHYAIAACGVTILLFYFSCDDNRATVE